MSDIITTRDAGNLDLIAGKIAAANAENGWHDRYLDLVQIDDDEGVREHIISKIMLVTTELAEAVEELRAGHGIREVYHSEGGKPEGVSVELADAAIRILDLCGMTRMEIGRDVRNKLRFNATRGRKHGGKTI